MSDAPIHASPAEDAELLRALCRELAEAADAVDEAARYASALALGTRLPATALRRGGGPRRAWRTLLHTLTDPAGLGWGARGRGAARVAWFAGILARRESLAVGLAVCGLKSRIRAARETHPELMADPDSAAVLRAAEHGRQGEAARLFRAILRDRGAERAFGLLTPSFADILAWDALTDDNPFNDHAGWRIATGRARPTPPLLALGAAFRAFAGRGPRPTAAAPDDTVARALPDGLAGFGGFGGSDGPDTSGTAVGYTRNLALIGAANGALLVQRVIGPDGVPRHVVQLAGPSRPRAGSDRHRCEVARVVRATVPSGTELALLGRGGGARTVLELAADRDFTTLYTVTHVVTVDSPPSAVRPADPRTTVFALPPDRAPADTSLAYYRGRVTGSHLHPLPPQ